jgi:antitoxin component YwqK of YwqJK toxin-antitoxin module
MEGRYHHDKEVGEWKNFWPNGRVKNHSFYTAGRLNGAWYSFSPEGKLQLFGRYKNDLKKGKWTEFYANGMKKEEVTYAVKKLKNASDDVVAMGFREVRSVEHGKYRAYSQVDFKVKETGRYANGNKVGKWINFYPGGVVPAVVSNYKKGQLHGVFCQYDRRGNKMNEIHYKKGLKDGLLVVYGKNGAPVVKKMFKKGHELQRVNAEDMFMP